MERENAVYVDLAGKPRMVGRLWTRFRRGQESATFEYSRSWLGDPERFALEPALALGPGPHHTSSDKAIFAAIGDSAPDRWGRVLMRRAERRAAESEKRTPRTLSEIDFLMQVDDEARQGALRFAGTEGGPFLETSTARGGSRIPLWLELPKLLSATERVLGDSEQDEDMRLLLAPGSSLGGARPKASIRDRKGALSIAKFPQKSDELRSVLWEAVALELAGKSGIEVPEWSLEVVARKPVLILKRFDRKGSVRIPFLSAMSMLGANDHETHSYLEIVAAIRRHGAATKQDLWQLWRRIVFSILISNTDDHLRNHAFLYAGNQGWRLSPAYDLNPVPAEFKPRILTTLIDENDGTASMELAFSVTTQFLLPLADARRIAAEVAKAVSRWRTVADRFGLRKVELDRVASAFEHRDLAGASGTGRKTVSRASMASVTS